MLHVVLFQPEIPPNTGNIIRLCANTGFHLHLIRPLGFDMDDKRLRRAGLDYREWQGVQLHDNWETFIERVSPAKVYGFSTRGRRLYSDARFAPGEALVFGPETRGLSADFLADLGSEQILRLPMQAQSRSLNLSNSAAVAVYEAWRQLDFAGGI